MPDDRRGEWNNSVEKRLVDLNSAQLTADTEIAKLRKEANKTDGILRGEGNTRGLIEAANHLQNEINKFNRIFDKDYLGYGGLQSFVTYVYNQLKSGEEYRSQGRGYKWAFWIMMIGALMATGTAILTNKDQVMKWLPKYHPAPLEQAIENAKYPKAKHRRVVIRERPPTQSDPALPAMRGSSDDVSPE